MIAVCFCRKQSYEYRGTNDWDLDYAPRSHSFSFDHRLRPETFRTAIATAFF
jgi:hypothetical protein